MEQSACCKPSTVDCYRFILRCFDDHIKTLSPKNITKSQVQAYLLHLCGRKLAPYTKVNNLLVIRKYLQWEVERGNLPEELLSVLDRSKLPKVPEYLPRPLSPENDRLLQNKLRESEGRYAPLFLLLRYTGMRISELINLPRDCIVTAGHEKYLKVPLGKLNNERLVPLTADTCVLIEKIGALALLKGRDPKRLIGFAGRVPKVYARLACQFRKLVGGQTDQNKPITCHRLRHTYATSLLTGGVGLVSLMKLLGHRRIEMTLRYAKITPSHLRDEYLKAIRVLESQSVIMETRKSFETAHHVHPSEMIRQIAAFVNKTNAASPLQKKNLLLRLTRLTNDLSKIRFTHIFKITIPGNNHAS